jgi:quinol monooxygenase YgiN
MTPPRKSKPRPKSRKVPRPRALAAQTGKAQDTVNLLIWLRARKGKEEALDRQLRALVAPSLAEPGCMTYSLHRSADRPGHFFLHEVWASPAHLARHWETPHFKSWADRQSAILESRRRFLQG